jgi:hypothetical protein
MWSGGVAVAIVLALVGCSSHARSAERPASPVSSRSVSPLPEPSSATTAVLPSEVAELTTAIHCDSVERRDSDAPGGPPPQAAYNCTVGEEDLSLFTYDSAADARSAFASLTSTCAPAVSGDTWIVWANTNEAATAAHDRIGGTLSLVRTPC